MHLKWKKIIKKSTSEMNDLCNKNYKTEQKVKSTKIILKMFHHISMEENREPGYNPTYVWLVNL